MSALDWPGSIIEQAMVEKAVGAFWRTHRGGGRLLLDWMASVPPDRSEEQYQEERKATGLPHGEPT